MCACVCERSVWSERERVCVSVCGMKWIVRKMSSKEEEEIEEERREAIDASAQHSGSV